MNAKTDFHHSIKKLYELEASIEAPDMNSLAIIWYLCIGRENINAVMVDHWEKSAGSELAALLGNEPQPGFEAPEHVFPLNKSTGDNFKMRK